MQSRATAKIKIIATPEIVRTLKIYAKGLQFCVDTAWKKGLKNHIKLQPFVYARLKKLGLQAQLAIACIKQACGMVKKAKSQPIIKRTSMRYNFPRSASLKRNTLSLATVKGRVKIPFSVPECYREYFSWKLCESLLCIDKRSRCYFMFTFSKEVDVEVPTLQSRVLGIDLGVNCLAATTDRQFFGSVKSKIVKRERLKSRLQAKGTKSAKRHLKRLSGRWRRFMAWVNHNISKQIVTSGAGVFVMEDLTYIRTRNRNSWVHRWAFRQLQNFIDYKAIREGCRVVYVNPAYTSQECCICHNTNTVRHRSFVLCLDCGHSLNSDLNASRNIAQRYMRNMCMASVTMPIVSDYDGKASYDELRWSSGTNAHTL